MSRIDNLKNKVEKLYSNENPNADPWIQWGYENHVLIVSEYSELLAKRYKASIEFSLAGALIHDIADTVMNRENPQHEQKSLEIATEILTDCGFSSEEVSIIVNEVISTHSCKDKLPTRLEGKILATADSLAHLKTDFYLFFCWQHWGAQGNLNQFSEFKIWVLKKIERDFHQKIQFDQIKEETKEDYESIKRLFSK